jgi:hypothetical protein
MDVQFCKTVVNYTTYFPLQNAYTSVLRNISIYYGRKNRVVQHNNTKQKPVPYPIPTLRYIKNRFHENNESTTGILYIQFRKDMEQYLKHQDKSRISTYVQVIECKVIFMRL